MAQADGRAPARVPNPLVPDPSVPGP